MTNKLPFAIGAGLAGAALLLLALSGLPALMVLLYLVPFPLFLAGLMLGLGPLAIAGVVGTALVLVLGGPVPGLAFPALFVVPALVIVRQALLSRTGQDGTTEWYPPGLLAGWLAIMAAAALAVVDIVFLGADDGLEGVIAETLPRVLQQIAGGDPPAELKAGIERMTRTLPAMMAWVWMGITALNAVIAQNVAQKANKALRPTPDYVRIEAPVWMAYALALAVVLGLVGPDRLDYLGANAAAIFALPFFFVGLAVAHAFARRSSRRGAGLAGFYIALILLGDIAMFAVSTLGLAEQFIHLRRRWAGP
ncbi:MAG: DUF2232 domain-containing protein [Alphaproteobacteria bacterium]|nr:DUF2232 domain-containing protein [Alphaproteobacteria bacterium]